MPDTRVEIYTDKEGRRRRRVVPVDTTDRTPKSKSKSEPQKRDRKSLPMEPRTRVELKKRRRITPKGPLGSPLGSKPMEPRGNPAVVETYEDARENQMINRDVPTMKNGGEAKTRGMGCAIKGGKFQGVF